MSSRVRLLAFAVWLMATATATAAWTGEVSVAATLGRTSVMLGDFLDYSIRVSAPPGTRTTVANLAAAFAGAGMETAATTAAVAQALAAMPATTATSSAPAAAAPMDLSPEQEHTAKAGEFEVTSRVWRVVPFRLGTVQLAGAEVQYHLPDGTIGSRAVPPVELQVQPVNMPRT